MYEANLLTYTVKKWVVVALTLNKTKTTPYNYLF